MRRSISWRVVLALGFAAACVAFAVALGLSQDPVRLSRSPAGAVGRSAVADAAVGSRRPLRIDRMVSAAKEIYGLETKRWQVHAQLRRVASDGILLSALGRGDLAGAQAEADSQLASPINHLRT